MGLSSGDIASESGPDTSLSFASEPAMSEKAEVQESNMPTVFHLLNRLANLFVLHLYVQISHRKLLALESWKNRKKHDIPTLS